MVDIFDIYKLVENFGVYNVRYVQQEEIKKNQKEQNMTNFHFYKEGWHDHQF